MVNEHIFCSTHPVWSVVTRSSRVQTAVDFILLLGNLTYSELMWSAFKSSG